MTLRNGSVVARIESAVTLRMHGDDIKHDLADLGVDLGTRGQQNCAAAAELGNTTPVADQ
jgi:hypothetical protein